jgi:hypothetical protein
MWPRVKSLIGDSAFLRSLDPQAFTDATFGVPTVRDILRSWKSPVAIRAPIQGGNVCRGRRGYS